MRTLISALIFCLVSAAACFAACTPAAASGNMARVEGGTFTMGDNTREENAKPEHQVTVGTFWIGKYEVTQKEWVAVMGSNPSHFQGENLPVDSVLWYDAAAYCNRLSLKEGLTPVYHGGGDSITADWSANGYRLPTEAEWEYAAKGGNKAGSAYEYSGGNDARTVGWYEENSDERTHAVGTKAANSLGIYDMSGNVYEWCWDWYEEGYAADPSTNPRGAASGEYRVMRGGSWDGSLGGLRTSYRNGAYPMKPDASIGFRVVRVY